MDMVERVATAIFVARKLGRRTNLRAQGDRTFQAHMRMARAAIAAMREPTEGMMEAAGNYENFCAVHNYGGAPDADGLWHAMIDAALTSSEPQAPSSE